MCVVWANSLVEMLMEPVTDQGLALLYDELVNTIDVDDLMF